MSAARDPLPNRRHGESWGIEHVGTRLRIQVNEYPDGRLGEVFLNSEITNSSLDALAGDAAILISLLLQHGVAAAVIGHALRRNPDGSRASLIGTAVDELARIDAIEGVGASSAAAAAPRDAADTSGDAWRNSP